MAGLDLKGLISKLNPVCQRALEAAAGLCLSRTNYNVEIEHWLVKLLEQPGNDLCLLLKHFEVDQARVLADLTKAIDRFKTGNARPPMLSPEVCDLIKEGWLTASVDFNEQKVRGAWLLLALLSNDSLGRRAVAASDEFRRIPPTCCGRKPHGCFLALRSRTSCQGGRPLTSLQRAKTESPSPRQRRPALISTPST